MEFFLPVFFGSQSQICLAPESGEPELILEQASFLSDFY
jgi:hypothetical protein